jgi:hypothetical protein
VRALRIDLGHWKFLPLVSNCIEVSSREASVRILPITAILTVLGSAAVAQTDAPKGFAGASGPDIPNNAVGGRLPEVYPGPGLDKVGPDGISTKVVRAAPCTTAARETDGTTTCVGIPGPIGRARGDDSRK